MSARRDHLPAWDSGRSGRSLGEDLSLACRAHWRSARGMYFSTKKTVRRRRAIAGNAPTFIKSGVCRADAAAGSASRHNLRSYRRQGAAAAAESVSVLDRSTGEPGTSTSILFRPATKDRDRQRLSQAGRCPIRRGRNHVVDTAPPAGGANVARWSNMLRSSRCLAPMNSGFSGATVPFVGPAPGDVAAVPRCAAVSSSRGIESAARRSAAGGTELWSRGRRNRVTAVTLVPDDDWASLAHYMICTQHQARHAPRRGNAAKSARTIAEAGMKPLMSSRPARSARR